MDIHEKVWGSEEWVVNCEKYCMKILKLKKGFRCSMHSHHFKDETFYILSGNVRMEIFKEEPKGFVFNDEVMYPGASIRITPNTLHRFTGIEDSVIIEVSTQHFEDDSYRITNSEKVAE